MRIISHLKTRYCSSLTTPQPNMKSDYGGHAENNSVLKNYLNIRCSDSHTPLFSTLKRVIDSSKINNVRCNRY